MNAVSSNPLPMEYSFRLVSTEGLPKGSMCLLTTVSMSFDKVLQALSHTTWPICKYISYSNNEHTASLLSKQNEIHTKERFGERRVCGLAASLQAPLFFFSGAQVTDGSKCLSSNTNVSRNNYAKVSAPI
jgi:hypothetical protein